MVWEFPPISILKEFVSPFIIDNTKGMCALVQFLSNSQLPLKIAEAVLKLIIVILFLQNSL
jgi:hypothetical protein